MKVLLMTLIGILVFPVFWILQKLGIVSPPPTLPPVFDALNAHLFRHGLSAIGEMQAERIHDTEGVALFRLGFGVTTFHVFTVALAPTEAQAQALQAEMEGAPQYTGVQRNGRLVLGCTFAPPDAALESRLGAAFMQFPPPAP